METAHLSADPMFPKGCCALCWHVRQPHSVTTRPAGGGYQFLMLRSAPWLCMEFCPTGLWVCWLRPAYMHLCHAELCGGAAKVQQGACPVCAVTTYRFCRAAAHTCFALGEGARYAPLSSHQCCQEPGPLACISVLRQLSKQIRS